MVFKLVLVWCMQFKENMAKHNLNFIYVEELLILM